jgi:DNA-directed RNA polymerase specialized sigma24 family protein
VYGFIRHKRSAEQAVDLTQEFFARLIEHDGFAAADQQQGRFRSWLLGAAKNFLANDWRRSIAKKRDCRKDLHIDALSAEQRYALEPRHQASPDRLFEQRLSLCFLSNVFETLRRECAAENEAELFDQLACFLPGGELEPPVYEPVAQALGIPVNTLKQRVFRLRKRYARVFHRSLCALVEHPDDVADEIRFMIQALDLPEA